MHIKLGWNKKTALRLYGTLSTTTWAWSPCFAKFTDAMCSLIMALKAKNYFIVAHRLRTAVIRSPPSCKSNVRKCTARWWRISEKGWVVKRPSHSVRVYVIGKDNIKKAPPKNKSGAIIRPKLPRHVRKGLKYAWKCGKTSFLGGIWRRNEIIFRISVKIMYN